MKLWQLIVLAALALPLFVPPGFSTLGVAYVLWLGPAIYAEHRFSQLTGVSGYRPASDFARRNAR